MLLVAAILELFDHFAIFACGHEIGARMLHGAAALYDDAVLHDDAAIQIFQMRIVPAQLVSRKRGVIVTQHRRISFEFGIEAREFVLSRPQLAASLRERLLLLVFDALAVFEHRRKPEAKFPHQPSPLTRCSSTGPASLRSRRIRRYLV